MLLLKQLCDDASLAGGPALLQHHAPLYVSARVAALQRAFANVVDNAIRYTERAEIAIDTNCANVVIYVRHCGPGINEKDMARVFKPCYRGAAAGDASRGSGLGLVIARDSLLRNEGTIELRNLPACGLEVRIQLSAALNGARDRNIQGRPPLAGSQVRRFAKYANLRRIGYLHTASAAQPAMVQPGNADQLLLFVKPQKRLADHPAPC
jgi:Histidine kinase-, DNA gyrase B-, and HSP90-like ATPase